MRSVLILTISVLFIWLANCTPTNPARLEALNEDPFDPIPTGTLMEQLHGLPHQSFTNGTVEASVLVEDTKVYGEALGVVVVVSAMIGLVLLIMGGIVHGTKYCGDEKCRFTCGKDDNIVVKWLPLVFIVIFTVLIVLLLILSWVKEADINSDVDYSIQLINDSYTAEVARYTNARSILEDIDRTTAGQITGDLANMADTVSSNAADTVDWGDRSNLGRRILLGIIGIFVLLTLVLGLLGAAIRVAILVKIGAILGWFSVAFLWISVGVHTGLAMGCSDVCYDVLTLQTKVATLVSTGQDQTTRVTVDAGGVLSCLDEITFNRIMNNIQIMENNNNTVNPNAPQLFAAVRLEVQEIYTCIWVAEIILNARTTVCESLFNPSGDMATYSFAMTFLMMAWITAEAILWKRLHFDKAAAGQGAI